MLNDKLYESTNFFEIKAEVIKFTIIIKLKIIDVNERQKKE